MGEFKKIETQEELDSLIKDRLDREKRSWSEKYADYDETKKKNTALEEEVRKLSEASKNFEADKAKFEKDISELSSKVKSYETDSAKTRIALEKGLPYEFAKRLTGETEEEITKDAEEMVKFVTKQTPPPLASGEPSTYKDDKNTTAYMTLAKGLSEIK